MKVFGGKLADAESTLMPEVRQWVRSTAMDLSTSPDDFCVIVIVNCPGMGILGAQAKAYLLSFVTNVLSDYPQNSIALLVHPNRASQQEGRTDHSTSLENVSQLVNVVSQ